MRLGGMLDGAVFVEKYSHDHGRAAKGVLPTETANQDESMSVVGLPKVM